jgi:predicted dehydrogenase
LSAVPLEHRVALRPVFVIGCGAIVREAHVPAYRLDRVPVEGFFDIDRSRASAVAGTINGATAYESVDALVAACERAHGIYDLALPPQAAHAVLAELPAGSTVLLQKPFGRDLAEATALLGTIDRRGIRGCVNLQLRHAPVVTALRRLLASGTLGEAVDLELRIVCRMPWEKWPFLESLPRMEILMHSIHYLDLCRALFGEPERVWTAVFGHPGSPRLADARSTTILSCAGGRRAVVTTYHHHAAPPRHEASHLRVECTHGTAVARLGVNLNYPIGVSDTLEWSTDGGPWQQVAVEGNWFPHGFRGPMREAQRAAADAAFVPATSFRDAWRTMALVETCYRSAARGEMMPEEPAPA